MGAVFLLRKKRRGTIGKYKPIHLLPNRMEFNTNKYDVQTGTDALSGINEDGKIKLDELKALNGMNLKGMIDWSAKERARIGNVPDTDSSKSEFVGVLDKFDAQINALKKNYEASKSEIQADVKGELAKLEVAIGIAKPEPTKAEAGTTTPGVTPAAEPKVEAPAKPEPAKAETVAPAAAPTEAKDAPKTTEYVVKKGDNLTKIAKENGTTVDALAKENGLGDDRKKWDRISVGQKLKVPAKTETVATDTEAAAASAKKPEAGKDRKAADVKSADKPKATSDKEAVAKTEAAAKPEAKAGETPAATATLADKAKVETAATKPAPGPLEMSKASVDQATLKSASAAQKGQKA